MASSLSGVAQAFLNASPSSLKLHVVQENKVILRIPACASEVGDLEVYDDGDELTVTVGRIDHCHFEVYCVAASTEEERRKLAAEDAIHWVTDILEGNVRFRNEFQKGRIVAGSSWRPEHHDGGHLLNVTDEWKEYTWFGQVLHETRNAT